MGLPVNFFNPNKHLKEEFVSNLTGSSMLEIFALSAIVPAFILFRKLDVLKGVGNQNHNYIGAKDWRQYFFILALDFLFGVLPPTMFFTVLAEWTYICAGGVMLLLVVIVAIGRSHYTGSGADSPTAVRRMISSYRVSVMIVTCTCILAVDFRIFPRRYAKTETYGTSLMDLGVGSFVLANSLVSRQARQGTAM